MIGARQPFQNCGACVIANYSADAPARYVTGAQFFYIENFIKGHVGKVQVAEDLILEASRSFLARTRQIDSARVAPQTFLVVVIVVDAGSAWPTNNNVHSFCQQQQSRPQPSGGAESAQRLRAQRPCLDVVVSPGRTPNIHPPPPPCQSHPALSKNGCTHNRKCRR